MPLTQTAPISDEQVRLLVDAFYRKIRADADLGPIFERVVSGDGKRIWPRCTICGLRSC